MSYFKTKNGIVTVVRKPTPVHNLKDWEYIDGPVFAGQLWDGKKISNAPLDPEILAIYIKSETETRITDKFQYYTKSNIETAHSLNLLTAAEIRQYTSIFSWITKMRTKCKNLIESNDETYNLDSHWPDFPKSSISLIDKY